MKCDASLGPGLVGGVEPALLRQPGLPLMQLVLLAGGLAMALVLVLAVAVDVLLVIVFVRIFGPTFSLLPLASAVLARRVAAGAVVVVVAVAVITRLAWFAVEAVLAVAVVCAEACSRRGDDGASQAGVGVSMTPPRKTLRNGPTVPGVPDVTSSPCDSSSLQAPGLSATRAEEAPAASGDAP